MSNEPLGWLKLTAVNQSVVWVQTAKVLTMTYHSDCVPKFTALRLRGDLVLYVLETPEQILGART